MKTFLKTIGYGVVAIFCTFSGGDISAQMLPSNQSVVTLSATNINPTTRTAIIGLELSDGNFVQHGFAFRAGGEMVFQGAPTKSQIGECTPDTGPGTDPYDQNTYREQQKTGLVLGETYYYYACAQSTDGTLVEGDIESFVIGNELIQGCTVQDVSFSSIQGNGSFNGQNVNLRLQVSGCNDGLQVVLHAIKATQQTDSHHLARIDNFPGSVFPDQNGKIIANIELQEGTCWSGNRTMTPANGPWGFECITYVDIFQGSDRKYWGARPENNLTREQVKSGLDDTDVLTDFRAKGILIGDCKGLGYCGVGDPLADDPENWQFLSLSAGSGETDIQNENCVITPDDIKWGNITSNKMQNLAPRLHIKTSGCLNQIFKLTIMGAENAIGIYEYGRVDIRGVGPDAVTSIFVLVQENEVIFTFQANDEECWGYWNNPDCQISVRIEGTAQGRISTLRLTEQGTSPTLDPYINNSNWYADKETWAENGILLADCGTYCGRTDWNFLSIQGGQISGFITPDPETVNTTEPYYDPNSPCYSETANDGKPGYLKDCYELLAPIAGIGDTTTAGGRMAITNLKNYELGNYIQTMINVALGILMVLAVIMIIVAGVQYMTVESFHGKTDARNKITNAVGGLILALGIFLILETINPQLLEINFGKNIEVARLGIDHVQGGDGYAEPGGTIEQIPAELMSTTLVPGKIYCPGTGGQEAIPDIARSFIGISTYRFGAKGSHLKPGEMYQDKPSFMCEGDVQCRTFCPQDSFCVDCSGFINHVLKCAGIINQSLGNTAMIFQGVAPYSSYDQNTNTITDSTGNYELQVGDLVGQPGHVAIYIGDGKIVESTSNQQGRLKNNNTQENTFAGRRNTFITHVRKFGTF